MIQLMRQQKKMERVVVNGYKAIESGVVSGYQKMEDGIVGGYKKLEKRFTDAFMADDEAEESKESKDGAKHNTL